MESYILGRGARINDLVEKCEENKKLCLFSGRRPKLGFEPDTSLTMGWNDINIRKIEDFCLESQRKSHLVIGFFSYELGLYTHRLNPKKRSDFPLVQLYSFENWVEEENDKTIVRYKSENFLKNIENLIKKSPRTKKHLKLDGPFRPEWDINTYKAKFETVKKYIKSGDIYQMNLTYPLSAVCESDPKDIFLQAQKINQASMAGLFQANDFELISLSPETFINIENGRIETFPIKGTKARSKDISTEQIENDLMNDKKEQAELNMISDLLRNDLSIICKPRSVKIESRKNTARLRKVIHTYSHITGELDQSVSPIQALISIFPGGSITGCPKKRALEIIDGLEEYPRGPYTGSLFTLDPQDNLEASILIRTLVKKGSSLSLPVGGGIVFDSNYRGEYKETLDKASSVIEVFD